MRISLLSLALLACSHPTTSSTIGNHGGAAAPAITFAEDLDHLVGMATSKEPKAWVSRASVVGWTADHRIAYRVLVCDPDELGGRGSWCQLDLCTNKPGGTEAECAQAASFELYDQPAFDRAATTTAHDAWLAELGAVAAGTEVTDGATTAEVAGRSLMVKVLPGGTAERLIEGVPDEDDHGVTKVDSQVVTASPDGACRAIVGIASMVGEYEGVRGRIPVSFAAVRCK